MKRMILVLFLLIGISPLAVQACSLAEPPSGFEIKVDSCEYGDNKEYMFDIIFEKSGIDESLYSTELNFTQINAAWSDQVPETLDYELDYMSIDNEFISLLGYGYNLEYAYNNDCFQGIFVGQIYDEDDPNPYQFEDFKIVVLDRDYNVVYTSSVYEKTVLPGESDTYSRFIYNPDTNTIITEEYNMFYPSESDCGLFYTNSGLYLFLMFLIYFVVLIILFSEFIVLLFIKANKNSVFISIVVSIISAFLIMSSGFYVISLAIISFILILLIQMIKYYVIIYRLELAPGNRVKRIIIIYGVLVSLIPLLLMCLYLFII